MWWRQYFSPEMIGQQGYDYCVDLWAFGILCFDLYEVYRKHRVEHAYPCLRPG